MIPLTPARTRDWLTIHGWSGVWVGLLVYVVLLTGSIAVLVDDIGTWASPIDSAASYGMPPGVDAGVDRLVEDLDPAYLDLALLYPRAGGRTRVVFYGEPTTSDGGQEPRALLFDLHPDTQAVMARHETSQGAIFDFEPAGALSNFYSGLHVHLHLPDPWGDWLVAIAALALMIAVITGFVVHGHLLKELFTLRRRGAALLQTRDTHTITGTWALIFLALAAVTGGYFSLHGLVSEPVLERAYARSDAGELHAFTDLPDRPEDSTPAPRADLDAMFDDTRQRSGGGEPMFVVIERWGRADAHVSVWTTAPDGGLSNRIYGYDGATGRYLRDEPLLGARPSLGGDLVGLMRPLHFGDFAGLPSKLVWTGMGLLGATVTLTGLLLWLRRREADPSWVWLDRLTTTIGYGLPCAMALAPAGFFVGIGLPLNIYTAIFTAFGLGLLLAIVATMTAPATVARGRLRRATGLALLLSVSLRWLTGGPGWVDAIVQGQITVLVLDAAMVLTALVLLWRKRPATEPARARRTRGIEDGAG